MRSSFVRATLMRVTEWKMDTDLVGVHSRGGILDGDRLEREVKARLEDHTDDGSDNLPFTYEFTVPGEVTVDKVRDAVVEKFAEERYGDSYVFPSRGEGEWAVLNTFDEYDEYDEDDEDDENEPENE